MFANNVFRIAFLISALTHGLILSGGPRFFLLPVNKKAQNIKVNYIKKIPQEAKGSLKLAASREKFALKSSTAKLYTQKLPSPPPFIDAAPKRITFPKPAFAKPDIISAKKIITLPIIDIDKTKISNPSYISYYQIVREKIRRAAYQNYTQTEEGEVYLSFIILENGVLRDVRLVEEKSSHNPYLMTVALKSIKEASPFPTFPKDLDYPQLSFNVIISFKIDK